MNTTWTGWLPSAIALSVAIGWLVLLLVIGAPTVLAVTIGIVCVMLVLTAVLVRPE